MMWSTIGPEYMTWGTIGPEYMMYYRTRVYDVL